MLSKKHLLGFLRQLNLEDMRSLSPGKNLDKRLLVILNQVTADEMQNQVRYI